MATIPVPLLLRGPQRVGPGRITLPQVVLSTFRTLTARLDPEVPEFDDPNVRITLDARLSFDGGQTWPVGFVTDIVGGARAKDGGFPFKQYPEGVLINGTFFRFDRIEIAVVLNTSLRLGLNGSAETLV